MPLSVVMLKVIIKYRTKKNKHGMRTRTYNEKKCTLISNLTFELCGRGKYSVYTTWMDKQLDATEFVQVGG